MAWKKKKEEPEKEIPVAEQQAQVQQPAAYQNVPQQQYVPMQQAPVVKTQSEIDEEQYTPQEVRDAIAGHIRRAYELLRLI